MPDTTKNIIDLLSIEDLKVKEFKTLKQPR